MNRTEMLAKIKERVLVEGRQSIYNPLLQKPTSLNPVGPGSYPGGLGGYAYIGPPPDFGGSYGCYEDAKGRKQWGIKASKMFSIYDGSPVQLYAELSPEERQALVSQLDEASESHKCPHCRSELSISVAGAIESKVHCPHCGTVMEGVDEKVKNCVSKLQEKNMSKAAVVKSEADLAKEAMKVEAPKDAQPAAAEKPKASAVEPHKEAQSQATEIKPMDELAKDLVKASDEEAAAKVKADADEAAAKAKEEDEKKAKAAVEEKKIKLQAAVEAYKKRQATRKNTAEAGVKLDAKTRIAAKREFRIMATFEPAKFAELKQNAKLASLCAEVEKKLYTKEQRAAIRAELKALAGEDVAAAEEYKKKLDFVAPEILMEEPVELKKDEKKTKSAEEEEAAKKAHADMGAAPAAAPAAPAAAEETEEEKAKKAKAAEDEAAAKKAKAEAEGLMPMGGAEPAAAMQTEFLASIESLKGERVEMSLYGEGSEDPFWNVTVDAEPVGRIHLADQQDAENIKASFMSDAYAENFGNAIDKVGLPKMLEVAKARLFAHKIDDSAITARLREKALVEAKTEFEGKVGTMRQDFIRALTIAMVATDKNYFQGETAHALKGGLFNSLVQAGLTKDHAVAAIEAGFEDAPEYFQHLTEKAVEIMDMPKESRESFEKNVMASGKIEIEVKTGEENDDLMRRLVKSSVNAIAMGEVVSGEDRKEIAARLGLKATRR